MRTLLFFGLTVFSACSQLSSAAVNSRDWKTTGDGLLTLDTVNKREWLDLSQTLLSDQFRGTGADFLEIRESRYQYVVAQTASGGLFEGFTVASSADVIALAQSAGMDTVESDPCYEINGVPTLTLGNLLGFTNEAEPETSMLMSGLLDETAYRRFLYRVGAKLFLRQSYEARLAIGESHTQDIQNPPGVMLYRSVPEPHSLILLILAGCHSWLAQLCLQRRSANSCHSLYS